MKILNAKYLLICNDSFEILQDKAVCFDEKIIAIDSKEHLMQNYPDAKVLNDAQIIMPGFINIHTHLEFSANKSILEYGGFIKWLTSVIANRDEIMELSTAFSMQNALNEMIQSGTTSIGAISSAGFDLEVCAKSRARVIYFNEILGSNPASVDILYEDFKNRLNASLAYKNDLFIPAISVHSPYSTHPILAKKALQIAQENDFLVSTHFLESEAEREWICEAKGEFCDFFAPFNPHAKPFLKPHEYLELFAENQTIFTHCCYANKDELEYIKTQNATITHCPRSNRLLGSKKLDLSQIFKNDINLTLGTDGLSSNHSLNIWDELRTALFTHEGHDLHTLSQELIRSVTINADKFLNLNIGSLEVGKNADLMTLSLAQEPKNIEHLATQIILHSQKAKEVFVSGENILT